MINIIVATSINGIIGDKDKNNLPWKNHYKNDLIRFKNLTLNSTVVMGKNTYLSIGRELPNRKNIIISKTLKDNKLDIRTSLVEVIDKEKDLWIIGGKELYKEGLKYADNIYLTIIPEIVDINNPIDMFFINPEYFEIINIEEDNSVKFYNYKRK